MEFVEVYRGYAIMKEDTKYGRGQPDIWYVCYGQDGKTLFRDRDLSYIKSQLKLQPRLLTEDIN